MEVELEELSKPIRVEKIVAKREFGITHEMSDEIRELPINILFTRAQFNQIKYGRIPLEMGDRWFIFYEEPILYFHWWMGSCIYKVFLEERREDIITKKIIVVNDESIKPLKNDTNEINDLISTIKYSLLQGKEVTILNK